MDIPLQFSKFKVPKGIKGITRLKNYQLMKTDVESTDRCKLPSQTVRIIHNVPLEYRLYTRYSIKALSKNKDKIEKEMRNSSVSHYYELTNIGPSVSDKPYYFSLVVPKDANAKIKANPETKINCTISGGVALHEISRSGFCPGVDSNMDSEFGIKFIKHDCIVGKDWLKNTPYHVIIQMDFNTNIIPTVEDKLPDLFLFPTFLKTKDECVSEKTSFFSSDLGKARAIRKLWPIILGVCIALLIFVTAIVVLYKKGFLSKLRFYNQKIE